VFLKTEKHFWSWKYFYFARTSQ